MLIVELMVGDTCLELYCHLNLNLNLNLQNLKLSSPIHSLSCLSVISGNGFIGPVTFKGESCRGYAFVQEILIN
jgi:hypothetical protein